MVGTQKDLAKLLNALIELDLDAIEAYRVAVEKLENATDKAQLGSFMADHERHVIELRPLVESLGEKAADRADVKAVLTKGKVAIGGLFGDRAVLLAMKTNEDDTNTAYERAVNRDDLPAHIRDVLVRNLGDERRHRAYIEGRLSAGERAAAHR
jgi:uncharacterized protein (TIGR02284 family)